VIVILSHSTRSKYYCSLIGLLVCFLSNGQDLLKEYKTFYESVNRAKSIQYDFDVAVYNVNGTVLKSEKIHFEKSSHALYYTTSTVKYFLNDEISIMVFMEPHKVMWSPVKEKDFNEISKPTNLLLLTDSLFKRADSIQYNGLINSEKSYTIFYSKQSIVKITILFDDKNAMLKRITYFYNKNSSNGVLKSTIEVKRFICAAHDILITRSEKDFVIAEGKKIKLSPLYKGYSLIESSDQLDIE
jgi:hypothetical protein